MMIETPFKLNDTITIRTTAGEEIVARFQADTHGGITVTKPLSLVASAEGIGLGPWVYTVDPASNININKDNILFVHKTEPGMASQYMTATTGLTLN